MFKAHLVLVSALMLSSASAFAAKVGDVSVASLTISNGQEVRKGQLTLKISKYDQGQQLFLFERAQSLEGTEDEATEEWKTADDVGTAEQFAQLLSNCAQEGGTSETVTVPAGSFAVCTLPLGDEYGQVVGKVSIGQVPFGVVRLEQTLEQGVQLQAELLSFQTGK